MPKKSTAIEGEVVKDAVIVLLDEQGVEDKSIRSEIVEAFGGPFKEAGAILSNFSKDEETGELIVGDAAIKVDSIEQLDDMKEARKQRLALREARITVENKRKELGEQSLRRTQAINGIAKNLKEIIEPAEKYLETQEKFAELHAAAQKAERLAARVAAIAKVGDPNLYKLEDMEEEAFQELLIKLEKDVADAAEAERQRLAVQEAEAKAERERQAKIAEDNERLRKEAAEQEAANQRKLDRVNQLAQMGMAWNPESQSYEAVDQSVAASDILELNEVKWKALLHDVKEVLDGYHAEHERKLQEEAAVKEAELEEQRKAAEAEREKREALEKAEADRKAAEEKAAADKLAAEHAAAVAPDKEKIKDAATKIEALKLALPVTRSKVAQELIGNVYDMLEKVNAYIDENIEKL